MGHPFFLSCNKATELVEKKQIAGLSWREDLQLTLHKTICGACKSYEKQSRFIDVLMKSREAQEKKRQADTEKLQQKIKDTLQEQNQ